MKGVDKVGVLAARGEHPHASTPLAFGANDDAAEQIVEATPLLQIPAVPAGIVRIGAVEESRSGCGSPAQTARSTSIFLVSAIAFAGESPLGQTFAQFMIVWQR